MISTNTVLGNRYRLISILATGGMGKIWRAWDKRHQQVVAVKVLKEELVGQQVFLSRLRAEANNAARVRHPALAAVYEYGETQGQGWIAMELVEGRPLSEILAGGTILPLDRLARIMVQVAGGLQACHDKQIVHRDVKPSNILVDNNDVAKLTDFGISLAPDREALTAAGMVMGTAQYLPPEQAMGNTATSAGDLYALGVICYEALSGKRPFTGATQVEIALAHVKQPVPPLPDSVPQPVADLVMKMLEKDPLDRPADAGSVAKAFEMILKGQDISLQNEVKQSKPHSKTSVAYAPSNGVKADADLKRSLAPRRRNAPVAPILPAAGTGGSSNIGFTQMRPGPGAYVQTTPQWKATTTPALPPTFAPRSAKRLGKQCAKPAGLYGVEQNGVALASVQGKAQNKVQSASRVQNVDYGASSSNKVGDLKSRSIDNERSENVNHVYLNKSDKLPKSLRIRLIVSIVVATVVLAVVILGLLFSRQDATSMGRVEGNCRDEQWSALPLNIPSLVDFNPVHRANNLVPKLVNNIPAGEITGEEKWNQFAE